MQLRGPRRLVQRFQNLPGTIVTTLHEHRPLIQHRPRRALEGCRHRGRLLDRGTDALRLSRQCGLSEHVDDHQVVALSGQSPDQVAGEHRVDHPGRTVVQTQHLPMLGQLRQDLGHVVARRLRPVPHRRRQRPHIGRRQPLRRSRLPEDHGGPVQRRLPGLRTGQDRAAQHVLVAHIPARGNLHRRTVTGELLVVEQCPRQDQQVLHLAGHPERLEPFPDAIHRDLIVELILHGPFDEPVTPLEGRDVEDVVVLERLPALQRVRDPAQHRALIGLHRVDPAAVGHGQPHML